MMRLIKVLAAVGALLGLASPVMGQSGCGGQFGALRFCGTIAGGLPGAILIPPGGTTPIGGNTVLGNPTTSSALPIATVAPILGIPGTSVGSVGFGNLTSGTVTIQPVTGALGSSVLSLPAITDTLAGKALANGGTNASLTASNGGIVWSNATQFQILAGTATARQMLQSGATATPAWSTATWPATTTINRILFSSAANVVGEISTVNGGMLNANSSGVPSMTVTPVLGVPTVSLGTLGFAGSTSGTATITAQFAAGTPTLVLPNASGTFAVNASSPLVLGALTGALTCPTCVTSSGGGAISGTAPVAVSAAGVVSITGAAGQVLAGAAPAFTKDPVLGVAGASTGSIGFANGTSGSITLTAPSSGALGSTVITFQAVTDTAVSRTTTDTLTNKTLTSSTNVLGGVTMTLGSDATGDIYYRSGGVLTRLPIGSSTNVLTVAGGVPTWAAASTGVSSLNLQTGALVLWPFPQGRLTLTSGTPVMATSVAAATTVYYTGYSGKNVSIYNGTAVAAYQICAANTAGACELSVALGANWATNSNYDWYAGLDSGTLRLCSGPAWTSDTGRGTGAGTTELQQIDGLNTNKVSMTCRYNNTTTFTCSVNQCTYLGTMRTGSAGQTNFVYGASAAGGTAGLFGLWNAYNRIQIKTTITDSTGSWTYSSATIRSMDNSTGNRVSFVMGLAEDGIGTQLQVRTAVPVTGIFRIGMALDATAALDKQALVAAPAAAIYNAPLVVRNDYNPQLGFHFIQATEQADGAITTTLNGGVDQSFVAELSM